MLTRRSQPLPRRPLPVTGPPARRRPDQDRHAGLVGAALIGFALAGLGCGEPVPGEATAHDSEALAYPFAETAPDAPLDDEARAILQQALAVLDDVASADGPALRSSIARATLERITEGQVLLGAVASARGLDRWHMCKDFELECCAGTWDGDESWVGDEQLAGVLETELDGYMWGNRLYFSFYGDLEAEPLASTVVHEVDHVLNRSECSYYADLAEHVVDDTAAFVEEYRAFFAECVYGDERGATADRCNAAALQQLDELDYGFEPDLSRVLPAGETDPIVIGEQLLVPSADDPRPYGSLVPESAHWPTSFGACPR